MDLLLKAQNQLRGQKGQKVLEVLYMCCYLAPGDIRTDVFSWAFPNPLELRLGMQVLQELSLVDCRDDSTFLVPDSIREELRHYIFSVGREAEVLKGTITILNELESVECRHLQSVYERVKLHPSLLEDIEDFPGRILLGLLREKRYQDAYVFGTDCIDVFTKNEGCDLVVLKSFMALVLLPRIQKREEAIGMMTELYHVLGSDAAESGVLRHLATVVIESNAVGAESRLRRIVFGEKSVDDSRDSADLEKWVVYSEALIPLGLMREAVTILDRVIEKRKDIFGLQDDGITNAMYTKTRALIEERKLREALRLLNTVLERKNAARQFKTFDILIDIGRVLTLMKNYKKSIHLLKKVARNVTKCFGKSHELNLKAKSALVDAFRRQHLWKRALKISKNLTNISKFLVGKNNQVSFRNKLTLGDVLLDAGKPKRARVVFQKLLEMAEEECVVTKEDIGPLQMRIFLAENINTMSVVTSLHLCAKVGDVDKVLSLLADGKDIDAPDGTGMTPLHYAAVYDQVQMARTLIGRGAKFNAKDKNGLTPLQVSSGGLMKAILRSVTFFFEAANNNYIDLITSIALEEPCVLSARDFSGCTPLHWAVLRGHEGSLKVLLELGCDPTLVSDKGNSLLHTAVSKGHLSIAKTLLGQAKFLVNGPTIARGNTPLHVAAERGFLAMSKILLGHGAMFNAKNADGKTPLQLTKDECCKNFLKLVEGLFLDAFKKDAEAVSSKLEVLDTEDLTAVMRTRNEQDRILLQVAREAMHLDLTKVLLRYMLRL